MNPIPIHVYLKGEGRGEEGILEAARYVAENTVSAVWVDVFDNSAVDLCKSLVTESPVIGFVHDPSLIGDVLDAGVSGIAVHPAAGPTLVGFRARILEGVDVYLYGEVPGSRSDGDRPRGDLPDGDQEDFFSLVNEITESVTMMKSGGLERVFVHIHHPNPVLLFNVNRYIKDRLGTKHVVSMARDSAREQSIIQNSLSLGSLFHEGIGDVLLITHDVAAGYCTGEEEAASSDSGENRALAYSDANRKSLESLQESILLAVKILGSCKLFPKGYTIISCPTCGRCRLDLLHITREIDNQMKTLEEQFNREGKKLEDIGGISVAVMGCNVNGPGEARNADIGIAGRNNKTGVLFKNGKPFKSLPEKRLVSELIKHTRAIIEHKFETA